MEKYILEYYNFDDILKELKSKLNKDIDDYGNFNEKLKDLYNTLCIKHGNNNWYILVNEKLNEEELISAKEYSELFYKYLIEKQDFPRWWYENMSFDNNDYDTFSLSDIKKGMSMYPPWVQEILQVFVTLFDEDGLRSAHQSDITIYYDH